MTLKRTEIEDLWYRRGYQAGLMRGYRRSHRGDGPAVDELTYRALRAFARVLKEIDPYHKRAEAWQEYHAIKEEYQPANERALRKLKRGRTVRILDEGAETVGVLVRFVRYAGGADATRQIWKVMTERGLLEAELSIRDLVEPNEENR